MENAIAVQNTPKTEVSRIDGDMFFNVEMFNHAQRVAKMLGASTMVPDHFRGASNIGNVLIAMNYASRVRMDVFMVMQKMCVIHGKPGIEAQLKIAQLNASGKTSPIQYKITGNINKPVNDEDGCMAYVTDLKTGEVVEGPEITWGLVKAEGWMDKRGSKWGTMPAKMFRYRSASWLIDTHYAEVSLGLPTTHELEDWVDMTPRSDGTYATETADSITARAHANAEPTVDPTPENPTPVADQTPETPHSGAGSSKPSKAEAAAEEKAQKAALKKYLDALEAVNPSKTELEKIKIAHDIGLSIPDNALSSTELGWLLAEINELSVSGDEAA